MGNPGHRKPGESKKLGQTGRDRVWGIVRSIWKWMDHDHAQAGCGVRWWMVAREEINIVVVGPRLVCGTIPQDLHHTHPALDRQTNGSRVNPALVPPNLRPPCCSPQPSARSPCWPPMLPPTVP